MADMDLQEIHDFLVEVAHKAGDMITSARPTSASSGEKKNCELTQTCMSGLTFVKANSNV